MKIEVKNFMTNGIVTIEAAAEDLNWIASVFSDASKYVDAEGYPSLKRYYGDGFQQIFDALDESGFYASIFKEENK